MSTKKISALTELAAAAAAADMIPIVDVSDTTDAATGTTKKITATNVCKGVGIGAGNTTAEPVKIDTSNAKLGVGTDTPESKLHVATSGDVGSFEVFPGGATGGANLSFKKSRGSVAGSFTVVADGDDVGGMFFYGADGNSMASAARIQAQVDGTPGDGDMPGRLTFSTTPDGSDTVAERMRIGSNGYVGIGVTGPTYQLHVANSSFTCSMERFAGASAAGPGIDFNKSRGGSTGSYSVVSDGDVLGSLIFKGADGNSFATSAMIRASVDGTPGDGDMPGRLEFATTLDGQEAVTERMRLDSTGNLLLGGTATPTSSVGNLCLFNGTAPAASVTNGVVLYAQDVSTSELKVRDEAGNVSTLSPHNFDMLGERSEDMAWSYSSKNVFLGKEVAVDMTKVIRALEKLTGEEYIKIRDIAKSEKLDWEEEEKRKQAEQKKEIDSYKKRKAENAAHPTSSSTKAEIKAYLDKSETEYEDAAKEELFKLVPEKEEFTEVEPAAYSKKAKPSWIK